MRKLFKILFCLFTLLAIASCRNEAATTTTQPTVVPSVITTVAPTVAPTVTPTVVPTVQPTLAPTQAPTVSPTVAPTAQAPTVSPTVAPTVIPTSVPTEVPTVIPTVVPTEVPTQVPTVAPTVAPTQSPTTSTPTVPTPTLDKFNVIFMVGDDVYKTIEVEEGLKVSKPENPTLDGKVFLGWYESLTDQNSFDFEEVITSNLTLYAKFEDLVQEFESKTIGYNEGLYVTWNDSNSASATVQYKNESSSTWISIDKELIRQTSSNEARADIVGLTAGTYSVKVTNSNGLSATSQVLVKETDRSGYAHFNYTEGIGAYNDDGTLKDKAVVVYVSEATKNTVKATVNGKSCTGLVSIIQAQTSKSNPLVIRIIGTIGTSTWTPIKYSGNPAASNSVKDSSGNVIKTSLKQEEIISKGVNTLDTSKYSTLNGLRNSLSYGSGEYDSCWNTLEVSGAANITVEGIGSDAELMNWGITFKKCSSIEVRNLTFTNNPEDACSIEGDASNPTLYSRYWVHNNVFNKGYNSWDLTAEQDKGNGDGSTDFKGISNITSSYNVFNNCKKTGLIGGSDGNLTMNVTFHHNYYNQVGSRLPLGRQANMHIYNNYYYKCGTAQDIRANAFVLSEANYFEGTSNPQKAQSGAVIKSYNDYLTGCGSSAATVVTSRTKTLSGNCKPDGKTNYSNFDIDSNKFYYDSVNQVSDVRYLTSAQEAKNDCVKYAGVVKNDGACPTLNGSSEPVTKYTVSFNSNGGSNVSSMTIREGNTIGTLPTATKAGYKLEGWYIDSALTTKATTSIVVTKDMTLYANWVEATIPAGETFYGISEFSTGTYTSTQSGQNFNLTANSSKNITIADCDASYGNYTFTKVLKTGGSGTHGSDGYRALEFTTNGACTITIFFASSGSTDRGVKVLDESGNTLGSSDLVDSSAVYAYTIEITSAQTVYFMSQNSGLSIYGFTVTY